MYMYIYMYIYVYMYIFIYIQYQAVKDFVLISSGVAGSWMLAAQNALDEFLGYINDDVESPDLAEVLPSLMMHFACRLVADHGV